MDVDFSEPYLETLSEPATPTGVPQFFPVSIAGRPYMIDTSFEPYRRDAFRHRSIQAQREAIDLTNIPGEGTVNTEGLWRRSADDWSYGAGQPYQDRKGSADARFSTSKGVNPWMQWQLSLLHDTHRLVELSDKGNVAQVGQFLYVLDRGTAGTQSLKFTNDLSTWTSVAAFPTDGNTGLATNGYDLWIANDSIAAQGILHTTAGATAWSSYITSGAFDGVWWVGERLMATIGPAVYNLIASGGVPTALWTHPNNDFIFSSMGQGSSQIYLAGYAAGQGQPLNSTVYRTTIEATGTNLTVPVQALPLEGGEYCTCLYGYLNFVFVGSNLGFRMCRTIAAYDPTGNEGDLEAGPLIPGLFPPGPVGHPIQAMVGNNRFMYFGWSEYDAASTGIGRADISTFIDAQAPAFTSDLMVDGSGTIFSMDWCTINQAPVFVVNGQGVFTASSAFVPSGSVQSGLISFGIPDDKIAMAGAIEAVQPQSGSVSMALSADGSVFGTVGTQTSTVTGGATVQNVFAINQIRAKKYTVQLTLSRGASQSPTVDRWTLKALPAITAGTTISVVIRMWTVQDSYGQDIYQNPYVEKAFFENLRTTQSVFEYVEGPYSTLCTVDEIDWLPEKARDADPNGGFQGNLIVYLKSWDLGT